MYGIALSTDSYYYKAFTLDQMSHIMRKSVFGVLDQARYTGQLQILNLESRGIVQSMWRKQSC